MRWSTGSPVYMSPEQCRGEAVDHRCDVYSLGCMLFEMIAGDPPFGAGRVRELLAAHKLQPPPSLAASIPGVPAWLADLVARMLAKQADERPQSMREVVAALACKDLDGPDDATGGGASAGRAPAPTQPRV